MARWSWRAGLLSVLAVTGARAADDAPRALPVPVVRFVDRSAQVPAHGALALEVPPHGLFLGDEDRWPQKNLAQRFFADLVSLPTNVVAWDHADFALFSSVTAGTVAMMAGPEPLDVSVQTWAHETFGRRGARPTLWTIPWGEVAMWTPVWGAYFGMALHGFLTRSAPELELFSLMAEAMGLAQVFELVPKVLLGREGPMNGAGTGVIHGPFQALGIWPAGTPSGHAATLYALMGTLATYVDDPWLTAALQAIGLAWCATLLVDDYHFASDLLWGAAEGWASGAWVVRHRSTKFDGPPGRPVRVVPLVEPKTGTAAVAVGLDF